MAIPRTIQFINRNWLALRDFLATLISSYVADSKLCSHANLKLIAEKHRRFLTIMPKTHKEEKRFRVNQNVPWSKLLARKNPGGKRK